MEEMKLTSFEEFQDKNFGKIGTPERDAFEKKVDDAIQAYRTVGRENRCAKSSNHKIGAWTWHHFRHYGKDIQGNEYSCMS